MEANDAEIAGMEQEEERLKLQYVESKLNYEKLHASKYGKQQELKRAREEKTKTSKEANMLKGTIEGKQYEWAKAHERSVGAAGHRGAMRALHHTQRPLLTAH